MAVIGNSPNPNDISVFKTVNKQTITGTGVSSYNLSYDVSRAEELEVYVNNVRQEPGVAYTIGSGQITFTGTISSSDECYIIYQGSRVGTVEPASNTITTDMMTNNSITSDKLHDSINTTFIQGTKIDLHRGWSDNRGALLIKGDKPSINLKTDDANGWGEWIIHATGSATDKGFIQTYHRDSSGDTSWAGAHRQYGKISASTTKSHQHHFFGGMSIGPAHGVTDEGRYIAGWYETPRLNSTTGSTYYIETDLWAGGSPNGNIDYIMGGFIIKGYRYASTNVCDARLYFHNWSGSYYNTNTTNHFGNWSPTIAMMVSTDGYCTLKLGVDNAYVQYRIDFWQGSTYAVREIGVRSASYSSP